MLMVLSCLFQYVVGDDAVDWLLATVGGIDRKQAVGLGARMWASGFFKHVSSKHRPFSDGPEHYYYFAVDHQSRFPPSFGDH
jgi:hypothetical protein